MKERLLDKVEEIQEEARTWTANDGGLTAAAGDVLTFAMILTELIKSGQPDDSLSWSDRWNTNSGLEGDLVEIALEWNDFLGYDTQE